MFFLTLFKTISLRVSRIHPCIHTATFVFVQVLTYIHVIGCLSGPLTADNRITASIYRSHIWKHHEKLNRALVSIASKSMLLLLLLENIFCCWWWYRIEKWWNHRVFVKGKINFAIVSIYRFGCIPLMMGWQQ